jgi:hypothetical protein
MDKTMEVLGLNKKIGCAPPNYFLNVGMDREDSLWRLYSDEVVPNELNLFAPLDTKDGPSLARRLAVRFVWWE